MFSRTTTESSIRREKARARPLRTMLLMVLSAECRTKKVIITESGIERNTAAVAQHRADSAFHEDRLVENDVCFQLGGNIAKGFDRVADALHYGDGVGIAALLQN